MYDSCITTEMMATILVKAKLQAKQSENQQVKGLGSKVRTIASEKPGRLMEYSTYDTVKARCREIYFAVCKL